MFNLFFGKLTGSQRAMRAAATAAALLAGPGAQAAAIIHQFTGTPDGQSPAAKLLTVSCGSQTYAYGTTQNGGTYNWGVVFSQQLPTGAEAVIHSFKSSTADGGQPYGGLIRVGNYLYGTTLVGGTMGLGTVYRIPLGTCGAPATPQILHSFTGAPDGQNPGAALLYHGGLLFGTASAGGSGHGAVFVCNPTGGCGVIYSFNGGADGAAPFGSLIFDTTNVGGSSVSGLFGTTTQGGVAGLGTIFALPLPQTGSDVVLHSFTGGSDGAYPETQLLRHGNFYYSTASKGGSGACTGGCGTVFQFKPASLAVGWSRSFAGYPNDGADPAADLVWDLGAGALYGTTELGGSDPTCSTNNMLSGCGSVFHIKLTGLAEAVEFSFDDVATGIWPVAGLTLYAGQLYGTSAAGVGASGGTVFSTPP
jgi:uncharacterized repeat protein (TIGR03803 family)